MSIQQMLFGGNSIFYYPYMDVVGDLYSFSSFTFTNGVTTGQNGPTSFSSISSYTSQSWYSTYFSVSSGIQYWYAPTTGSYTIRAAGAAGQGGYYSNRCRGIIIESTITLTKGMLYRILVGQMGTVYSTGSGGGGGGTFMTEYYWDPIIIAGGGGGARYSYDPYNTTYSSSNGQSGTSGSNSSDGSGTGGSSGNGGTGSNNGWGGGGGGLYGNGTAAFQASGSGYSGLGYGLMSGGGIGGNTATSAYGGFGGGAGTHGNTGGGGGGGGYSGGGGSNQSSSDTIAGGGGSYSQTAITEIGYNQSHGYLTVTKV